MKKATSQERINELIQELGITQREFAERTGLAKSTVSMYLSGQREPKQDGIALISKAFGVNPVWLMGMDAPKRTAESTGFALGSLIATDPERAREVLETFMEMPEEQYISVISMIKALKKE